MHLKKIILFFLVFINISCNRYTISTHRFADNRTTNNVGLRMSYKNANSISGELNTYVKEYLFFPTKIEKSKPKYYYAKPANQ